MSEKIRLKIRDKAFGHALFSNNPMPPVSFAKHIEWVRPEIPDQHTIYTDGFIAEAPAGSTIWLLEPLPNQQAVYSLVNQHPDRFRAIWTHDAVMLDLPNAHLVPFGGCWIEPELRKVWGKSKDVSVIASHKQGLYGQRLRHEVIEECGAMVDARGGPYSRLETKAPALIPYRFSVVAENCRRNYWFTEKLLDCFLTGTVPIYWGCPAIGDFFNLDGIIVGNGLVEIAEIVRTATPELHASMAAAIEDNFQRAQAFVLAEDWIVENKPELLEPLK